MLRRAALVEQVLDGSRRYADRIDTWRLPTSETQQDELALNYGKDGFTLLAALHAPAASPWLRTLPAVLVLRQVLVQSYTRTTAGNGHVRVKRCERTEDGGDGPAPPQHVPTASPR